MKICPYCGQSVADNWSYCHNCNKPLIVNINFESNRRESHIYDKDIGEIYDIQGENEVENNASDKINGVVEMLINMRKEARENKNWALSDKIRDELAELGIQLKDGKEGTSFTIN